MSYVSNNTPPIRSALPGIHHVTRAGAEHGLQQISVWDQIVEAGGATPPHRHDCEEVVLCSSGRGELHLDGSEVHAFGPNTTVRIPRNALHQIFNVGDEPLRLIAVFGAAPVEARFPDGTVIELPWQV